MKIARPKNWPIFLGILHLVSSPLFLSFFRFFSFFFRFLLFRTAREINYQSIPKLIYHCENNFNEISFSFIYSSTDETDDKL